MKILITGSNGFIGKNLIARLESQNTKNHIIYKYDMDTPFEKRNDYTKDCDFVYNLAAVHRPKNTEEFYKVNYQLFKDILDALEKNNNPCPVLYTSSVQVNQDTEYADSKRKAEEALRYHSKKENSKAVIYRLTNTFGKWASPNHHSVIATFCYNLTRHLDITITDPDYNMNFYYIDDVIDAFIKHLEYDIKPDRDGYYRLTDSLTYTITLGKCAELLQSFQKTRSNHTIPDLSDAFTKKLYSTYLSYLPKEEFKYPLTMHQDARGSFTELFKTADRGQFSVNVAKPGITKGGHYHNTKCEKFLVISGKALIQLRNIHSEEILEFTVSSETMEIVDIPAGYTHTIKNIGENDLVTFIWANEIFDPQNPDTYYLPVLLNPA